MLDKIVQLIEAKGWKENAFESRAELPQGRISKWKGGKGEPSAIQALKIARLLEVPLEHLIDESIEEVGSTSIQSEERAAIEETIRAVGENEVLRRLSLASGIEGIGDGTRNHVTYGRTQREVRELERRRQYGDVTVSAYSTKANQLFVSFSSHEDLRNFIRELDEIADAHEDLAERLERKERRDKKRQGDISDSTVSEEIRPALRDVTGKARLDPQASPNDEDEPRPRIKKKG